MKLSKRQIFLIGGIGLGVLVFILVIFFNLRTNDPANVKVTLRVWGFEDPKMLSGIFGVYKTVSPNVTVEYTRVSESDYDKKLLEALALQKGPDVFVVDNNSLLKWKDFLAPVDPKVFNLEKIKSLFPQVVEQDFVSGGRIYALPYSIDTLALVYNRDFFDEAGIIDPPKTWDNFQIYVQALRRLNEFGAVVRAGAAMGGVSESIPQAADILNWLMMQNGAIEYENESLGIKTDFSSRGDAYKALAFYAQFSDPKSQYYSWTGNQGTSLKTFADRKTAMILVYKKDIETIKKANAFLDFGVGQAPQITGAEKVVSYSDYVGYAVSKQSRNQVWAWDFIVNTATNISGQKAYLNTAKNPPALRALIGEVVDSVELGVFARQALTARSWPQGDEARVRAILEEAVYNSLYGNKDYSATVRKIYDDVSKLLGTFKVKFNG
ncbi:MAG: extracellular solute-binding protein [Patescibacteria group bacterium]